MRHPSLPGRARHPGLDPIAEERRTANAIYGVIVSASVMAASHAPMTTGRLAVAVLVTLLVYWAAERYAAVMAGRIASGGAESGRTALRRELTDGWELVTASFLPILVLVAADLLGADLWGSVIAGLVCSTVLLFLAGLEIGAEGRLRPVERWTSAAVSGTFGLVLIALKMSLH
jgi:hypothetical protein